MPRHAFDRLGRLSLDEQYAVDQLCTRFEASLRAGESPSPGDYLDSAPGPCRPALLGELIAIEMDSHHRQGTSFDPRHFVERFPDLAAVIDELLGEPPWRGDGDGDGESEGRESPGEADPDERPKLPHVEGYDLIAEIGRGGMGVVYKARHRALGRLVALKMILAGDFADGRHLSRFLDEGAILARLQHPHIVQVFDFGHQDGRPFLALEYVEGGSLSAWPGRHSLSSREGAHLVETLARAVHVAHRKGIVHRDLKPANILLQWLAASSQTDTPDDRTDADPDPDPDADAAPIDPRSPIPKITDFGLARCDDETHSLTESGLVVGTPSYMSPEQALNERSIGPTTDVYSLGAILYDLLVGRPPFRAETPLETVNLVLEREPPRPSKWQSGLPQDLETICLKCLEKDPARRYASAEALADDLRRWRQGKPIHARPIGPIERVGKWCRRQPMLAALIAAVILLTASLAILATAAAFRLANERNEALAQRERAGRIDRDYKLALVDSLMSATPDSVPYILETLRPAAALALPILRRRLEDRSADTDADIGVEPRSRIRAAIALTVLGDPRIDFLLDAVPLADDSEGGNLALAFRTRGGPELAARLLERSRRAGDPVVRARHAILLLELGDLRGVRP
ncbi:MAG: serine/threonine-protein kinase, partial [Isosphaeraceae bacterium]